MATWCKQGGPKRYANCRRKASTTKWIQHHLGNQHPALILMKEAQDLWDLLQEGSAALGVLCSSLGSRLVKHAGLIKAAETKLSRKEWEDFITKEVAAGTSVGHKLTKVTHFLQAEPEPGADPYTAQPIKFLAEQAALWGGLWQAAPGQLRQSLLHWEPMPALPPLTSSQLRKAALSFKGKTSCPDGWLPSKLGWLSEQALQVLASILSIAERFGALPGPQGSILVRLLAKEGGGCRPIGLYRALYRVLGQTRKGLAQQWEGLYANGALFNMGAKRCVGDGLFRATIWNGLANKEGRHSMELLWDVAKCFEHVRWGILQDLGKESSYPACLLRMSLASCAFPRWLLGEVGMVSGPLKPQRGILAGSSFAVFELKAYMVQAARQHRLEHPSMTLSVHVDDISLNQSSKLGQGLDSLVMEFQQGAARLVNNFQVCLCLPFAPGKAVVWPTPMGVWLQQRQPLGSMQAEPRWKQGGLGMTMLWKVVPTSQCQRTRKECRP